MILLSENFSPFLFRTKVPVLSYNMYIIPIHTLIICCVNCCNSHCKFKIQNENLKRSTLTPTLWCHFLSIEKSAMSLLCPGLHYLNIVSMTNFQIFFFFWRKERNTTLFNISRVIFSHFRWIVWFHHELKVFKNRWIRVGCQFSRIEFWFNQTIWCRHVGIFFFWGGWGGVSSRRSPSHPPLWSIIVSSDRIQQP